MTRTALLVAAALLFSAPLQAEPSYGALPPDLKKHLNRLARAYPDWIKGFDEQYLILKDGRKFAISDGSTAKTFDQLLTRPDIDDMFYVAYPAGTTPRQPPANSDPGRVRYEPLFVAMYGDCDTQPIVGRMRTIQWLPRHRGGRVLVTTVNGVDKALAAVSRELDELPDHFVQYLKPTSGSFKCRRIAGSTARSMHAYGAAIDINDKFGDYWRRSLGREQNPRWKNRVPIEIVRIFERHGFIWGGYWYHYDTMHFEYRPELLPARDGR